MKYNPRISIICAISENRVIGQDDRIPWHIKADLVRFKNKTLHHTIIIGKKTYESMKKYYKKSGRMMPERNTIIITHDTNYQPGQANCHVVNSFDQALEKAKEIEKEEVFVSGGEQIFRQAINIAERLYLTIVKGNFSGNKFFPDYSGFTKVIKKEECEENGQKFYFIEIER